jgi:hypothetical protein
MPLAPQPTTNPLAAFTAPLVERWLLEVRRATDAYLRSPAFLGSMQQSIRAMTTGARFFLPPWIR